MIAGAPGMSVCVPTIYSVGDCRREAMGEGFPFTRIEDPVLGRE